jgi:hypothetical protein
VSSNIISNQQTQLPLDIITSWNITKYYSSVIVYYTLVIIAQTTIHEIMHLLVQRSQETYRLHDWEQTAVNDVGVSTMSSPSVLTRLRSLRDSGARLRKQVNR